MLNSKSGPLFPHCPVKIAIFRGLGGVPCKNLKSYDNPFWGKSNKVWKSADILPEECGYIFVMKIMVSLSCSAKPLVARNTLGPKSK